VSFPAMSFPALTYAVNAWQGNTSMSDFGAIQAPLCTNFTSAWNGCSALTSFPADAKLGTAANNVNFNSAWQASGLTSFPALDLSNGNNFSSAWRSCSALTSFPAGAKLGTSANNVNFQDAWRSSGITSFSTPLPTATNLRSSFEDAVSLVSFNSQLPLATNALFAWDNCSSLTSFDVSLPSLTAMYRAWAGCSSLTDFSADVFSNWNPQSISSGVFDFTWQGCTALTAQSVENILTSIDASGKYATSTGASGGSALGDSGIDIDYNVATGSLSAATNTAIDSLSGKGWEVYINGVLVIPNILDLEPAAAYSLRSFDADADPNVVNVRRSSDSASSDFKASEVSDGTLTDWVNTDVDLVTPTLNNGGFENGSTGWIGFGVNITNTTAYAGINSVEINVTGGAYIDIRRSILEIGKEYKVSFWSKISDSSKESRVGLGTNNTIVNYSSTDWEYNEVTGIATGATFLYFARNSSGDYTINIDDITLTQLTSDGHVTTWYDQGGTNHASQTLVSNMPLLVDGGTLVTEGGLAALDFDGASDFFDMNHSDLYGQSTLDSYYVTSTSDTQYLYPRDIGGRYGFAAHAGDANSTIHTVYGTPSLYSNGILQSISNRIDVHAANNGYKLVNHQGADTSAWGTFSFGRYNPVAGVWDYDGKLQEMIFFNTDQSANRTAIETNINSHFTIYS